MDRYWIYWIEYIAFLEAVDHEIEPQEEPKCHLRWLKGRTDLQIRKQGKTKDEDKEETKKKDEEEEEENKING